MLKVEDFLDTRLYKEYKDTYVVDKILKNYFKGQVPYGIKVPTKVHSVPLKSYEDVYKWDINNFQEILALKSLPGVTEEDLWAIAYDVYIDPDGYDIRERSGVACSADALLSFKRIYTMYGYTENMIAEYEKYRKYPIFHFPKEKNGINMSRAAVFGDRIDSTLLDLKVYYENGKNAEKCRLQNAFNLEKTSAFLNSFADFSELVDWLGVRGSFVNEQDEVFDLENGNASILINYHPESDWKWSDNYYKHVKSAIDKYMELKVDKK